MSLDYCRVISSLPCVAMGRDSLVHRLSKLRVGVRRIVSRFPAGERYSSLLQKRLLCPPI